MTADEEARLAAQRLVMDYPVELIRQPDTQTPEHVPVEPTAPPAPTREQA